LEKLKAAGKIRNDIDLMVAAFSVSSMSFTVGFMAQVVFRRDREELKRQLQETARLMAFAMAPKS
jgi:sensor histidine kinase regulating citrate/malate metabolism